MQAGAQKWLVTLECLSKERSEQSKMWTDGWPWLRELGNVRIA
jgi:hypothetical protein